MVEIKKEGLEEALDNQNPVARPQAFSISKEQEFSFHQGAQKAQLGEIS